MEYTEYTRLLKETDSFISSGRLKEAETAIYQLMAFIFDRLGKIDEALSWYEKGTAYEQIYGRFEITEKKAEYLSQVGRSKEAISIYETLSIQPFITEADKDRIHKMIQTLLGKQMREWH
jgi:tetratricopeptide (TPR) repeat protein